MLRNFSIFASNAWQVLKAPLFVIGAFLAGEVVVRLIYFGPQAILHPTRYHSIRAGEANLLEPTTGAMATQLIPGKQTYFKGRLVSVNSLGFRGPEITIAKPANTSRIVIVGDSNTFGSGVTDQQVYPQRLEKLLREQGHPCEVVNLAVPAFSPFQMAAIYGNRGRPLAPDVAVFPLYGMKLNNKLYPPVRSSRFQPPPIWKDMGDFIGRAFFLESALVAAFDANISPYLSRDWLKRVPDKPKPPRENGISTSDLLIKWKKECLADGTVPVVAVLPRLDEVSPPGKPEKLREYEKWQRENPDAILIDLRGEVRRKKVWGKVFPGDPHPDARVHEVIAELLAEKLAPLLPPPARP